MINCSEDAAAALLPPMRKWLVKQEAFVVLMLNARNQPIGRPFIVALGTVNGLAVHPRDVFREAVKRNATAVIVGHNHPSGSVSPSEDDLKLTERLVAAGELLGIQLFDHIVLSAKEHYSFADRGLI